MKQLKKRPSDRSAPVLSFEFFPPRNEKQTRRLWRTFGRLEALNPAWVSVTYGALGSASQASLDTVAAFQEDTHVPVAAHLTCSGQTHSELESVIDYLQSLGVQRIVALRGDAPAEAPVNTGEKRLRYASELVELLVRRGGFDISVAAYPEIHPEATSAADDIHWLKAKLDAGAARGVTQFFFAADVFLRWRDRAVAAGIDKPLIPGILPIHDIAKVCDFSARCGATVPQALQQRFAGIDDPAEHEKRAVEQCLSLCGELQSEGVSDFHFYTLNQSRLATLVAEELMRPARSDNAARCVSENPAGLREAAGI